MNSPRMAMVSQPSKTIWLCDYTMEFKTKQGISRFGTPRSSTITMMLVQFATPGSQHNLSFRHGNHMKVLYMDGHAESVEGTEAAINSSLAPERWNIFGTAP